MRKVSFIWVIYLFCFAMIFFQAEANAADFKVSVSLKDNNFFLEPKKPIYSSFLVSNTGDIDAHVFATADIDKDAPFEIMFESNPTYLYTGGMYDRHLLINGKSYGMHEIKFSIVAPYDKIKKEQKKKYRIKINVFASPIFAFADEQTIKTRIRHQYQYEINVDLSDEFIYSRDKKMSFKLDGQEDDGQNQDSAEKQQEKENQSEKQTAPVDYEKEENNLYFGTKANNDTNLPEEKNTFPFSTVIITLGGIFGIYVALKS